MKEKLKGIFVLIATPPAAEGKIDFEL